jgi:hypothetical protein
MSDRWRYLVVEVKAASVWSTVLKTEQLQAELDRHGSQGWELVSTMPAQGTTGVRLLFKRPA